MAYKLNGHPVSKPWHTIGTEYKRRSKKGMTVTSGRRTMRDQWRLVRQKGVWSARNPTGAAYPSPGAPHILWGRADHALDVSTTDGGAERLCVWLRKQGVACSRPIAAEPWHVRIDDRKAFLVLAARIEKANAKKRKAKK